MTHPPGSPQDPGGGDGTTGPGREATIGTSVDRKWRIVPDGRSYRMESRPFRSNGWQFEGRSGFEALMAVGRSAGVVWAAPVPAAQLTQQLAT